MTGVPADLVIVANRLPVDRITLPDGTVEWRPSPGGLVTAIEPVMRANDGIHMSMAGYLRISGPVFERLKAEAGLPQPAKGGAGGAGA